LLAVLETGEALAIYIYYEVAGSVPRDIRSPTSNKNPFAIKGVLNLRLMLR